MIDWVCIYIALGVFTGFCLGYCVRATRTEELDKRIKYSLYWYEDYKKDEKIKTLNQMVVNLQEEIQKLTGELE